MNSTKLLCADAWGCFLVKRRVLALKYTSPHSHAAMSPARSPEPGCALAYIAANDSTLKHTSYSDDAKQTLPDDTCIYINDALYHGVQKKIV